MESFLKLCRDILEWGWYKTPVVCRLFIHCLLEANYKDNIWYNISIERGSFITSHGELAERTGLSRKQVQTALKKLSKTNDLIVESNKRYTKITIINYEKLQEEGRLGFAIIFRALFNEDFYIIPTMCRLYIHLIIKINYKDKKEFNGNVVKKGSLKTSCKMLERETGIPLRQIRYNLYKLEKLGKIMRFAPPEHQNYSIISMTYYDDFLKWVQTGTNEGPMRGTTKKERKKEIYIYDQKTNKRQNEEFEKWWALYPKKVGKKNCIDLYAKITKTVKPELLLKSTSNYAERVKDRESKWIKNPKTWLEGEHWMDEHIKQTHVKEKTEEQIKHEIKMDYKIKLTIINMARKTIEKFGGDLEQELKSKYPHVVEFAKENGFI